MDGISSDLNPREIVDPVRETDNLCPEYFGLGWSTRLVVDETWDVEFRLCRRKYREVFPSGRTLKSIFSVQNPIGDS